MGKGRRFILKITFITESLLKSDYVEKKMKKRSTRTRHITWVLSNCNVKEKHPGLSVRKVSCLEQSCPCGGPGHACHQAAEIWLVGIEMHCEIHTGF